VHVVLSLSSRAAAAATCPPLASWGPVDTFLLALLAVVALAAVFPASGTFADVLAVAPCCSCSTALASGLPMALVFFGTGAVGLIMLPLMIFHQIQLFVCAIIASRMSRTVPAS
jgi:sodium/bile acid cotransporter 7